MKKLILLSISMILFGGAKLFGDTLLEQTTKQAEKVKENFYMLQFKNIGNETYKVRVTFTDGTQQTFEVAKGSIYSIIKPKNVCLNDAKVFLGPYQRRTSPQQCADINNDRGCWISLNSRKPCMVDTLISFHRTDLKRTAHISGGKIVQEDIPNSNFDFNVTVQPLNPSSATQK